MAVSDACTGLGAQWSAHAHHCALTLLVHVLTLLPPPPQVVTLDMGLLVAGTKYRGEFEERLKKLMDEIKQNDDIILVSAAGGAEGCAVLM
jgi:hypothetical protein